MYELGTVVKTHACRLNSCLGCMRPCSSMGAITVQIAECAASMPWGSWCRGCRWRRSCRWRRRCCCCPAPPWSAATPAGSRARLLGRQLGLSAPQVEHPAASENKSRNKSTRVCTDANPSVVRSERQAFVHANSKCLINTPFQTCLTAHSATLSHRLLCHDDFEHLTCSIKFHASLVCHSA